MINYVVDDVVSTLGPYRSFTKYEPRKCVKAWYRCHYVVDDVVSSCVSMHCKADDVVSTGILCDGARPHRSFMK